MNRQPIIQRLSGRQQSCLQLAALGRTTPEIARELGISPRTTDQYIAQACLRLDVRNRVQAVATAVGLGWISPTRTPHANELRTP